MACCFCAMGLTEHAARDPETLRREVESTYRQLSRTTHPDRVGLAFPSQDFLFLTTVKDRCLAKIQQRETKCTLFEYRVRGGGFTPPPAGGGLTPPPAASYSGAGAAPPWAKADDPPWAAGSNNHRTTQQPEMDCMFHPCHGRHGLAGHCLSMADLATAISSSPGRGLDGTDALQSARTATPGRSRTG